MAEISISIENKYVGGEHKVITKKQQFLGIVLCFFMYFKMAVAIQKKTMILFFLVVW